MKTIYTKSKTKLYEFIDGTEDFKNYCNFSKIVEVKSIDINDINYKIGLYNVIIEEDGIYSVHLFASDGKSGRNTAVIQNTIKLLVNTIDKFEVHLHYTLGVKTISDFPNSNQNEIRLYKTLGVIVHDKYEIDEIEDFDEFLQLKKQSSIINKGNRPIFVDTEFKTVYLKFSAASSTESMFLLIGLKHFDDSKYMIYRIQEPNVINNNNLLNLITKYNYDYVESVYLSEKNKIEIGLIPGQKNPIKIDEIRNQSLYNYLVNCKYEENDIVKKCAICEVCEEEILEHAHILEIKDIKKMTHLDDKVKMEFANSPDNAILLCRNHHTMFDRNKFIIEGNKFKDRSLSNDEYSLTTKKLLEKVTIESEIADSNFMYFVELRYQGKGWQHE